MSEEYIPLFRRRQRVMPFMEPEFERILNGDVVSGIVGLAILERWRDRWTAVTCFSSMRICVEVICAKVMSSGRC